ncbi:hypothetical protein [Actinoplanes sp. NPDC049316]|uniref:hypothetical protein n=1 Tax=Actinoplanes sp. NPDC049316 TaxID=3154727 RepID=UPI003414FAA7
MVTDAADGANGRLTRARRRLLSPSGSGRTMSRQELADAANAYLWSRYKVVDRLDATYIGHLEQGRYRWPGARRREALRHVLGVVKDSDVGFYITRGMRGAADREGVRPACSEEEQTHVVNRMSKAADADAVATIPNAFRRAVMSEAPAERSRPPLNSMQLVMAVEQIHTRYQRAEYLAAAEMVPALMAALPAAMDQVADHRERRRLQACATAAHLAVSKLALKLGDAELAWVTGDRALAMARETKDNALVSATLTSIGCALLALPGRVDDAARVVESGLPSSAARTLSRASEISAYGALTLLAAVIASRQGRRQDAEEHLASAGDLASRLGGDRNDLWTAFGPTNVLIHAVQIATPSDPRRAIALATRINTSHMPVALVSRRSQIHLDMAHAFLELSDGDASALLHLLQAERLAPQMLRLHPPARALIARLLSRERRVATPGLRELAVRVGVAV